MIALAASGIQSGLGGLMTLVRFGHAKAVTRENSALDAADSQVSKRMAELENLVTGGQLSDAQIDSKLQAMLDEYYQIVGPVIQGRITTEDDFNPATKKARSGAKCNAACVFGGRTNDLINAARPKLKALAAKVRKSAGGAVASKSADASLSGAPAGGGAGRIGEKIGAAVAPVLGDWVHKVPPWLLVVLPGGGVLLLLLLFRKRRAGRK